ncbi:apolipoprotein N-acyltransferase [Trueperella pecoris]|uniref:Apolipoprotein N-acyltransferase n=1 Tax=Trueperella pecoris TaxID=2733571 RepID=A0A7M1R2X6_9ACTO|nr:apolipoprotein N-acyltransferase [Trueperella pecoris]QOR48609.1 apolipoprotein N-acyltransferase [Trueperella pecoris]
MVFKILLAIAGGLSMWLSNEPMGVWALSLPAISLLWLAVQGRGMLAGFGLGWVWGFFFFFPLFDWATAATGLYVAQIALAALQAAFIGVVGALWAALSGGNKAAVAWQVPAATFVWLAVEQVRGTWPFGGLPWGSVGFALVDSPIAHVAPYGSTALVGAVAIAGGLLLAMTPKLSYLGATTSALAVIALVIVPVFVPMGGRADGSINVAVVQGNVPDDAENRALRVTENHVRETRALVESSRIKPDLILWPESSSDRDIRTDRAAGEMVLSMVDDVGIPLVMGTQQYVDDGRYNDVVVIEPGRGITDRYSKQHPVPFGEYVPFREALRKVTDIVDLVSVDMLVGQGPATVNVPIGEGVSIATPICFEVAYTDIVSRAASASQLIVIPTNNASFGTTGLSAQQFSMTKFRAMENGRTAVQVSTSGISGVVDSHGRVAYETGLFESDARIVSIALHSANTFAATTATQRGVLIYLLGAAGAILAIASRTRGRS